MILEFFGAARTVTGSKHMLTTKKGLKILLDCGLYQGKGMDTDAMNRDLGFLPSEVDILVLSHAHIDHSGLIPYIYKHGFRGTIFCTPATRDLCAIMLLDSAHIQEYDTVKHNRKRAKQGKPPVDPIYTKDDANACLGQFVSVPYNHEVRISKGVHLTFTDAGHILGSAAVNLRIKEDGRMKKLCFTGDIGRKNDKILRDPQPFPQCDYLITESTYGDRLHDPKAEAEKQLLDIVNTTCVEQKGKLIIPSFSVGRTQEVVYTLDRLETQKKLPRIDVFVDSPLSVNATNIMRMHPECFNKDILKYMETDPNPFGFNRLHYIQSVNQSKALNGSKKPAIIISASGMMEAGRVKHHISNNIEDPRNTILAVGYCAPGTLGSRLLRGDKKISIFGHEHLVKAGIYKIDSYSAHGDYEEMANYLDCQDKSAVKNVFIVHGEIETQETFKNYLHERGFRNISIPERKDKVEL